MEPPRPEVSRAIARRPNQIPGEILDDPILNQRIEQTLPKNYNFEIHKTIWRIRKESAKCVCLQFPDGLFLFSVPIVDLLREFTPPQTEFITMADVTYGACCIDDVKARQLGCDMIVHYGHSCLVPINRMSPGLAVMYVFVDIKFDLLHLIQTVAKNFDPSRHRICLAATIQFVSSAHLAGKELREKHGFTVIIPQSRPLTPGEVLGCTAPTIPDEDGVDSDTKTTVIVFVADGRFHMEALMMANPRLPAYRYDPYSKDLTREYYQYDQMIDQRSRAVHQARQVLYHNRPIGIIIGTLGRQGSFRIFDALRSLIRSVSQSPVLAFMIAEIDPPMLERLAGKTVQCWVQIGCPRLSIDWGAAFVDKPLLSPYELRMAVKQQQQQPEPSSTSTIKEYPMDFYASSSLGNWTPNHKCHDGCQCY